MKIELTYDQARALRDIASGAINVPPGWTEKRNAHLRRALAVLTYELNWEWDRRRTIARRKKAPKT